MANVMRAAVVAAMVASGSVAAGAADREAGRLGDAEFVRRAAWSDMFETQSSELAAIKGDAVTRAFAARMNEAHQKTSSELGQLVKGRAADLPLPPRLDSVAQQRIDRLSALDGADFVSAYLRAQIEAHEAAVRLFARYAASGVTEPLKAWATSTLPKLEEHLRDSRALTVDRLE